MRARVCVWCVWRVCVCMCACACVHVGVFVLVCACAFACACVCVFVCVQVRNQGVVETFSGMLRTQNSASYTTLLWRAASGERRAASGERRAAILKINTLLARIA